MAAALLAALLLAGCGGSSSDRATTTAAVAPAPTTTTDATGAARLTAAQMARLRRTSRSFVSGVTTFLAALNRCTPAKARAACVRRAVDRAEPVVQRTRSRVSALATGVGGDCSAQLGDLRSKITAVTDVLGPMAEATARGSFRSVGRLGTDAQASLRSFATSSLIVDRAC